MGGVSGKHCWSFKPFRRRDSRRDVNPPSSSLTGGDSSPFPGRQPNEFVCPISGKLMADPVVVPDGRSFERACVKALIDIGLVAGTPINPTGACCPLPPVSSTTPLIANDGLRSAIISWCDSQGHDRPRPVEPDVAVGLVQTILGLRHSDNVNRGITTRPIEPISSLSMPSQVPSDDNVKSVSGTSCSASHPSASVVKDDSWSSSPVTPDRSPFTSVLEERVVSMLASSEVAEQEIALKLLRHVTREHTGRRVDLCTEKLLSSLIPFIKIPHPTTQADAVAIIVNLSLHPSNKISVARASAVPPLVAALKSPHPETRSQAASAIFSLSTVDGNKALVGALGAISTLLDLLSNSNQFAVARRDSALALHHLTTGCSTNLLNLIKLPGAARALLKVVSVDSPLMAYWETKTNQSVPDNEATGRESDATAGVIMLVILNMAGCENGRSALMDAGAVKTVVGMLQILTCSNDITDVVTKKRREQCVGVLHSLSWGGARFHGLAVTVGAEEVLRRIVAVAAEEEDDGGRGDGDGGRSRWMTNRTREKARKILRELEVDAEVKFRGGNDNSTSCGVSDLSVSP